MKYFITNIRIIKLTAIVLLMSVLLACDETVLDVDFSAFEKNLVVEGIVKEGTGKHKVELSRVENYFYNDLAVLIDNAVVTISDNSGGTEILTQTEPGKYITTDLPGIAGKTYTLTIKVGGETYGAKSTMPEAIELSKLNSVYNSFNSYTLELFINDNTDKEEFAKILTYQNGNLRDEFLYRDQNLNGETIKLVEHGYNKFDEAVVEIYTLSKSAYQYLRELKELSGDSNSDENVELASGNPPSNISNNGLGYFSAQAYRRYEVVVK